MRHVMLALALLAAPVASHAARSASLDLDPQRTVVRFVLPGTLHETRGTFRLARGSMEIDAATGAARGLIVVDARSGESGNARRDRRMRGDVLETDAHPEIAFRPDRIEGLSASANEFDGTIHGTLVLLGVEHPIDVPAHARLAGSELTATCRFSVPYVAWGLTDPSLLFLAVAKDVAIDVTAVGHVRWNTD